VHKSLLPGGLFLFDLNDERLFPKLFTGGWTVEQRDLFVSVTGTYLSHGSRGTLHFNAFERRGRDWRRTDFSIRERNWRKKEVEVALRKAGLLLLRVRKIQPYPPDEVEAPRTLWICRKGTTRRHATSGSHIA
jgi:hypothetical protein